MLENKYVNFNERELDEIRKTFDMIEIGRASVGKECRSRWSPYH